MRNRFVVKRDRPLSGRMGASWRASRADHLHRNHSFTGEGPRYAPVPARASASVMGRPRPTYTGTGRAYYRASCLVAGGGLARVQEPAISTPAKLAQRGRSTRYTAGRLRAPFARICPGFSPRSTHHRLHGRMELTGVMPTEGQRPPLRARRGSLAVGYPAWDRYGKGHPLVDDYPYMPGRLVRPVTTRTYSRATYPIIGQHTFLDVTAGPSRFEFRQIPTATTPFESTARPGQNFFGRPNSIFTHDFFLSAFDLFHGDAAFKPVDWRIKLTPIFNVNNLLVQELAIVSPNVSRDGREPASSGRSRRRSSRRSWPTSGPTTTSSRSGSAPSRSTSDFRGFLFDDINRGGPALRHANANRDQFNLVYFRQWEKDTNSGLNTFNDRGQNSSSPTTTARTSSFPGYTAGSLNYDNDPASFKFDKNRFLVRPDPVGRVPAAHSRRGLPRLGGDGHIGRFNITHQFYWALGYDSLNPLANQAADDQRPDGRIERSYDRDWVRFRASFF